MEKTIYLLDSNAIIHSDIFEKCTEKIKNHIKGTNPKFVIPAQVSKELRIDRLRNDRQPRDSLVENDKVDWVGKSEKNIRKILKDRFGISVKFYILEDNVEKKANELFKNYEDLEYSDALLLASMINRKWDEIITNDRDLKLCCEKENVEFFDHTKKDGKWLYENF